MGGDELLGIALLDVSAMLKEIIFLGEEAPEGGYVARALGHSIFTEADSWAELREAVQDAVRCHFEEDEVFNFLRRQ